MTEIDIIREHARRLGFTMLGVVPAGPCPTWPAYARWLDAGYAGEMAYLERRRDERRDVRNLWPEARSVVVLAMDYRARIDRPDPLPPNCGIVSSYAWGGDYHDLCWRRLDALLAAIRADLGPHVEGRGYVDTGPILERDVAAQAGLGWIGKNTVLISPDRGSWFFLAELVLDIDLPTTKARVPGRCGACTRCIDACPTRAFVTPRVLDAGRCISYLTIEHKGSIPRELRPLVGPRIFGCDVCQDVCPWNERRASRGNAPARGVGFSDGPTFQPRDDLLAPDLVALLALTEDDFHARFQGSPILRAKRRGLLRNAATALGNVGDERAVPALEQALADAEPLVREHAGWALMRIAGGRAVLTLEAAVAREPDDATRADLAASLIEAREG